MALIMYLTKAPRYKNTTIEEIKLIESYFHWQHEKEIGSRYGGDTFEKWCGHSETELPNSDVVDYYKEFLTKKTTYVEGVGNEEHYSLFTQMARFVKANQILNWFVRNVMDNKLDNEFYEVSKEQLEGFLTTCNEVKDSFTFLRTNEYTKEDEYEINEDIADRLLPLMKEKGYFFGSIRYNDLYAEQVIDAANIVKNILDITDFEKETIYFNTIW